MYTHRLQSLHISRIRIARHITRHQTFHEKRYSEDVHARVPQRLDGGRVGPGVILVQFSGDVIFAKLCAGLVYSNPCAFVIFGFLALTGGRWECLQVNPEARFLRTSRACTRLAALAAMIKLLIFIVGKRVFVISIRERKKEWDKTKRMRARSSLLLEGNGHQQETGTMHLYSPSRINEVRPVQ